MRERAARAKLVHRVQGLDDPEYGHFRCNDADEHNVGCQHADAFRTDSRSECRCALCVCGIFFVEA